MAPRSDRQHNGNSEPLALPKDRSVNDYETEEELRKALMACGIGGERDWVLKNFDASTTIKYPNSVDAEVKRLLCLKSYDLLDTDIEPEFEDITNEAKQYFGCPIAVVSLVDLGRQWFKSIQGLDAESTPRCLAFCAHVVKRKPELGPLIVPDATKDERFKDNALVTGAPKIRFYAGAPLVSPGDGHVLGSLCVIDTQPHPEGLTRNERKKLEEFASHCVFHMISKAAEFA